MQEEGEEISLSSLSLLSRHVMKLGCYTVNLGTEAGQRLHATHLLILPLIPILILLGQNYSSYTNNLQTTAFLSDVLEQVSTAQFKIIDCAEIAM